jgi:tRNA(adenine34) deaminase
MTNFMQIAIEEAKKAATNGEVPVGAAIVQNGTVIAVSHNQTITNADPTAHAEVLAIRAACQIAKSQRLENCDLYVTLEPCPMCVAAISAARIRNVYFGAYDAKSGGVSLAGHTSLHHKPEYYGGFAETECAGLMTEFFKRLR